MHPIGPAGLQEELRTSSVLIDAIRAMSGAASLDAVIQIVKHAARRATGADGAAFVLRDGDQCWYVDEDSIAPLWKGRRFPMSACVSGWAMHHRLAVAIPDIEHDERVPVDAYRPTYVRSLAMVPIRSCEPIGAIGVYWSHAHTIAEETVHWLQALADATAAAIQATRAQSEAEHVAAPAISGDAPEIVRMCAWTRRIQHDGEWISLEAFLRSRFGLLVSHGISEEALAAIEHELDDDFRSGASVGAG